MIDLAAPLRFAIVTTHNRPNELQKLVMTLCQNTDLVVIIDNASHPHVTRAAWNYDNIIVVRDEEQPPNLYRLWNLGLDTVAHEAHDRGLDTWDVCLFNDDADVPSEWFSIVTNALRSGPWAAASTASYEPLTQAVVHTEPNRMLFLRMCPWAFVARGELNLRADERFRWWFGDTDFDWQLRTNGGVILVPGPVVPNTLANSTTVGELATQAGKDREAFGAKWGFVPW